MVFRTVYMDHEVDRALRAQAAETGVQKGQMFRIYLAKGMHTPGATKLPLGDGVSLSVRSVLLPESVDDNLRGLSFSLRIPKSELIRKFLYAGMGAMQPRRTSGTVESSSGVTKAVAGRSA